MVQGARRCITTSPGNPRSDGVLLRVRRASSPALVCAAGERSIEMDGPWSEPDLRRIRRGGVGVPRRPEAINDSEAGAGLRYRLWGSPKWVGCAAS